MILLLHIFDENRRACMAVGYVLCTERKFDSSFFTEQKEQLKRLPFNADGDLTYYVKKGEYQEVGVLLQDIYCLEVEQLGNCICETNSHVTHEFSLQNAR